LLLQPLEQVDANLLQKLCDDRCPESQSLEFKRDLPGHSDKDKHEICKDVAALANTDGGDLVYGIDEKAGSAGLISPITGESFDAAIRRIAQVLDAGIEPRIQGLKMRHIDVPGGYCIVLRVPSSFDGPHCIRTNQNRRFVMRNGTSITDMSFDQLRGAFDRTATLAERARRFIVDRLQLIADRRTAAPLMTGPYWVVHLVPMAGLAGRMSVDLRGIYSNTFTNFLGHDWYGGSRTFNFDGLLIHPGNSQDTEYYEYLHIFRTGALESARIGGDTREVSPGVEKAIVWSLDMSNFFYHSIKKFLDAAKTWGFAGPAVLSVAILNVKGYELGIGDSYHRFSRAMADRQHLIPPDLWIEDIDSVDIDTAVRPLLDTLWQAFGAVRCLDFDDVTGTFAPRRN
jgi:hypothetical protein